jgi:hypothetical protein
MIKLNRPEGAYVDADNYDDASTLWHCVHLHVKVDNASVYVSLTRDEAEKLEHALHAAQREIRRREDERLNKEIEELDRKYPRTNDPA